MEHQLSYKGDGYVRDGNSAKVFVSSFQCWREKLVPIFSLCLLSHAYHVVFQLVNVSLDVTVILLVYMDEILCRNSDSYEELIRDQQR